MRRHGLLIILALFALTAGIACKGKAPTTAPTLISVNAATGPINLLAMGDWGRDSPLQREVAKTLADYVKGSKQKFQGMLLAGDNFYVSLSGTKDPAWQNIFEKMYDSKALDMPFFAALGNHDYSGGKAQIEFDYARENPQSRWKLPARWYRIDIPAQNPTVVAPMLDSNRDDIDDADWAAEMKWMDQQLAGVAPGTWTIACAHHPLFSNGSHGDNGALAADWGPIFKRHDLSFYICGHDHDLQHLEIAGWSTSLMLVGGGGAGTREMRRDIPGPFSRQINGFAHLQFTDTLATIRYIAYDGSLLHTFTRNKSGEVKVIATTASDAATSQPLRAIQGGGKED